jgi:hypothetical protein
MAPGIDNATRNLLKKIYMAGAVKFFTAGVVFTVLRSVLIGPIS